MKRVTRVLVAAVVAASIVAVGATREMKPAEASDPAGVYALVDAVTYEPGDGPPTRVRLSGLFCTYDGQRGSAYRTPRAGSLVFSLTPGEGEMQSSERKIFTELESIAGTGKVAAFGSRHRMDDINVVAATETPRPPPVLVQGIGVRVIDTAGYGPIAELLSLPRIVSPSGDVKMRIHEKYGAVDSTHIVVRNPAMKADGLRLLFEIERENGDVTASGPVKPGDDGTTTFDQRYTYRENETVTFRVRAVHDDLRRVAVAVGTFTVRRAE